MGQLIVFIGWIISVRMVGDVLYVQPNNKYTWVEYDNIHYNLVSKEIFVYSGDKLTIGVN